MSGKISGGGSIGARKGGNVISDISAASRKMVQSLKEIVNCPEAEIYAMLKECNMDPNEAVNRLLSQDPFHEVKSKREKKKENRDTTDSRSRGANNNFSRGGRVASDRFAGRSSAMHFSSSESGHVQGRATKKRENGTLGYGVSASSMSGISGRHHPYHSDSTAMENKTLPVGSGNGIPSSQSASGHQPAWFGAAGQMSMADIVKMGRPQIKTANAHQNANMYYGTNNEYRVHENQHVPFKDEWPSNEKPVATSISSVLKVPTELELCSNPADFQPGRAKQYLKTQLEEIHVVENGLLGTLGIDQAQPDSMSGGNVQEDAGVSSQFDDGLYRRTGSYQTQDNPIVCNKDEDDASSIATNLQQLSLEKGNHEALPEDDRPGVIIPDHLQVHTPECSQLSFGSFGGFVSRPLSNNLAEVSDTAPSIEHSDARNNEFYGDEHLGSSADGNMVHAANASAANYDSSSDSQQEVLNQENSEAVQEDHYTFAQSEPGYAYENVKQQLNTAFDTSQTGTHMQNLAPFSNVMQGYTNPIPSTLLPQTVQSVRELDLQYSPFPAAQSTLLRSSNTTPSLSGQSISMPEALRRSGIPSTQSTQQNLPSAASFATGPALPQHLAMHPYSQPTLPLTHFANMIGYPLLPQSYPYLPSAFQQAFAGNNSYNQSLAALLPQYKNTISASNLPQSVAAAASTYGFGNSTNVSASNFPLNPPAAPTGTALGYEDMLGSQFKESNQPLSFQQQNENSLMWLQGPGSRTMSALQTNTFYDQQGQQNQQAPPPTFRQPQQQPSQLYGSLGYPNFYQSQTAISLEQQHQQQQITRESGAQGPPPSSKQTQQLWQNSY